MSENIGRAKLKALRVSNVKSIREVEITPDGEIIEIRGDSGQGKTSILEAIEGAIRGLDASMIRQGESAAEIVLETSAAKINRIIHADGSRDYLAVTGADGKKIDKAKDFLSAIFGAAAFNPLEWVKLGGGGGKGKTERLRTQRDMLLNAMPVSLRAQDVATSVKDLGPETATALSEVNLDDVDFGQHALVVCSALQKACYEFRKAVNEKAEMAENKAQFTPAPEKAAPTEDLAACEKAEEAALAALNQARGAAASRLGLTNRAEALRARIEQDGKELPRPGVLNDDLREAEGNRAQFEREIEDLREKLRMAEAKLANTNTRLNGLNSVKNQVEAHEERKAELKELEGQLGTPKGNNIEALEQAHAVKKDLTARRRAQDAHDASAKAATQARKKAKRFDALVALFRDELPRRVVESMSMPVEGLGVEDGQVTLNGIPLHQLGTSQQIRIGVRVAAALNPRAGFALVDGAESMGREDRRALAEEAEALGVQLIMTYVDPDAEPAPGRVVMRQGEAVA